MYRVLLLILLYIIDVVQSDTNYRLNTPIKPSSYAIAITPYFDTGDANNFTFDGEVIINFTTESNTNQIKLHSEDLIFTESNITVSTGSRNLNLDATNPLQFNQTYTFAYINLQDELQVGFEYSLKILYRGPIRKDLNGFYRNDYIENGVKKWLGATQMEPTHARKAFPCFDEPELKATFTLTIDRPVTYQPSLANTKLQTTIPLSNSYVREVFYPTPRMSTYLVAFLVSEFNAGEYSQNGTKELGIFTRPEAVNQSSYAFDISLKVVDALSDYFGIDYYSTDSNLKLDHIALVDFRAGAMENWGLITYREAYLLYVPEDSTPTYKYRVAQIIAHETTHMWFGNLVTCHWWSNTWLNEGFANYFQDYILTLVEPNVGADYQLIIGSVYSAYDADSDVKSAPITNNNVNSPAEISGHFGTITYQKAGSVIRMMHHLVGDEAFKYGLNNYLNNNSFNSGYPYLMYSALSQGVSQVNALEAYPEVTIADVMDSWISQAGHPLLKVDINYDDETATLTQKRFYLDSIHSSDELYKIPISYTSGVSPNFVNTKPAFIMDNKTHVLTISNISQEHSWVIFNIQETGLYRVNYDDHAWEIIINALKGAGREEIHYLNRAKIVNDLFALFYADEVNFGRLVNALEFLSEETDYAVWFATIRGLNKLRTSFLGTDVVELIEDYARTLLNSIINKLGYEVKDTDSYITVRNRMQVLEFACKVGHEGCIANTVAVFRQLKESGIEVPPSLRPVVYCQGLRYGDGEDYEFLWRRMASTNIANEARTIGEVLGCSTDQDKLKMFLVSMLEEESPVKVQDLTMPLTGILSNYNNVHLVLNEMKDNYNLWTTIYTSMDTVLATIASSLHTAEDFEEFEAWLSSCTQCSEQTINSTKTVLETAKASADWASVHRQDVLKNLRNTGAVVGPYCAVLFISLVINFI